MNLVSLTLQPFCVDLISEWLVNYRHKSQQFSWVNSAQHSIPLRFLTLQLKLTSLSKHQFYCFHGHQDLMALLKLIADLYNQHKSPWKLFQILSVSYHHMPCLQDPNLSEYCQDNQFGLFWLNIQLQIYKCKALCQCDPDKLITNLWFQTFLQHIPIQACHRN